MSQFEFSTVLVSIVIAIVVTEILATWGRIIRQRRRVHPYWIHLGWMALTLLLAIQFWWSLWELREWPDWSFFEYVFSLLPFLTLVVLAFLLCPDPTSEAGAGLEEYFFENAPWFFSLAALFLLELMVTNPILRGEPWLGIDNGVRFAAMIAVLSLSRTRSRLIHGSVLVMCAGLFVAFVILAGPGG